MQDVQVQEILKKCIDVTPAMRITKKKDLKVISETAIELEVFPLDLNQHEDVVYNFPHASLYCLVDTWEPYPDDPVAGRGFVVLIVSDDSEKNADAYTFFHLLNAISFIQDVQKKYSFYKDCFEKKELDIEHAHWVVKRRAEAYKLREANKVNNQTSTNG